MTEHRPIETTPGMVFDATTGGAQGAPLVLLLHGFGVSRHYWNAQITALAEAGFFAVAPDQRGYSACARPDPSEHSEYRIEKLIGDAFDIVAALGYGKKRFHLVGHDWGGSLAWHIADQSAERLRSLAMLSRPHPQAFNRALNMPDGEQKHRSRHHGRFLEPDAGPDILADNAKWLRTRLAANGVPEAAIAAHLSVLGNPPAMEAALAWYRARGVLHKPVGPITVPTLYIWGDTDDTVGRAAAEGTGEFVVAPYRFMAMTGVGHYAADQVPGDVSAALVAHVRKYEV